MHRHHHRRHHRGVGLLGLAIGVAAAAHTISKVARYVSPPRRHYIPPPPPPPPRIVVTKTIVAPPVRPIIPPPVPFVRDPILDALPPRGMVVDPIVTALPPPRRPMVVDPIVNTLPPAGKPMVIDPIVKNMIPPNPSNNYPAKEPGKNDTQISSGDLKGNNNEDNESVSSYSDEEDNGFSNNGGIYGNPNLNQMPPYNQPFPQMPPPPQNYNQYPPQNSPQMPPPPQNFNNFGINLLFYNVKKRPE